MSKSYFIVGYYRGSRFLNRRFSSLQQAVDLYKKEVDSDSGLADFDIICKNKKTGKRYFCDF